MASVATLAVRITGDVSDVQAKLNSMAQSLQSAGDKLQNLGGKLTAGVSVPILGMGGAALKAAADNEQLEVAFGTMLGSAEKAKALMADLATFAAATPFESSEIQQASKMLLAYGVGADSVTDEMRRLGDIAAGVGVPLQDMAYLYGTARVQGRLFTADINQFTTRGIPIMEALSATMGVATGEIRGMVEEGKVGFPELQAALAYLTDDGGKFSGLMEAQSTTLTGLFSTLKDNISLAMIDIGNAIAQAFDLKTNAVTAIAFVERIRDTIADLAKNNPELLRTGVIIAAVAAAVGPLVVGLGMFLKAASVLTPALGLLSSALGLLVSPLGLIVAGLAALVVFDVGGIRTMLGDLGSYFAAVVEDGDYLNDWLTHLPEAVQPAVQALGQFVAAVAGLAQGGNLSTFIAEVTAIDWGGALAAVGDSLNQFKDNIIAAIQAIDWGGALTAAGNFLDGLRDGVVAAVTAVDWGGALATAAGWLDGLKDGVVGAIQGVDWGGALTTAGDFLAGLAQGIAGQIAAIDWGGALETAAGWLDGLKSNVVSAIQGIDWGGALTAAGNAFGTLETAVAGGLAALGFAGAADGLNLATVTATVQEFVASIGAMGADIQAKVDGIKTALQPLIDFLEPSFSRLGETVVGLPEQFGALAEKFGPLADAAGKLGNSLGGFNTIGVIVGVTLGFLANAANAVLQALTPLAGALIEQATATLSGLAEIVSGLVTAFQGIVNNNPQQVLEGLSTAFGGVKEIVGGTFVSSLSLVQAALTEIGTIVSTTLSDWGFSAAATAVETLVTNITALLEKIKAIASGDTTINFAAPDWIVQLLAWLWPGLELPDVVTTLLSWQWPDMPLPEILDSLLTWVWPGFPGLPTWVDNLMGWEWPSLNMPEWLSDLFNFKWPSLPQLPSWLGGPSEADGAGQLGITYARGGNYIVGEAGRELVTLPRGASVIPNRQTEQILAGAGGVNVTIQQAHFGNEADSWRFAYQVDDLRRRRRM